MAIISSSGNFLQVNPTLCRMLGYNESELLCLNASDITHPDDRTKIDQLFDNLQSGEQDVAYYEKRFILKNGSLLWGYVSLSCVRGNDGAPLYHVGQVIDTTERKKAEDALVRANRDLEAFTSTVSHDLRSSLAPFVNIPPLLAKRNRDLIGDDDQKLLELLERRGRRMQKIMDDLLTLARVGFLKRPLSPVSVEEIVQEILQEMSSSVEQAGIIVQIASLPELHVPSTFIVQIFGNLIGNALKYAAVAGSSIEIGGNREGDRFHYFVRDHGPGIPEEERNRIFYPFYRSRAEGRSDGAGIGLAIVEKIARLCNGRVWVTETDGGGCTFRVELTDNLLNDSLTEEFFEKSDAKYRPLFTQSAEAILLMTDRFFECNEQACRLFGGDRSTILGSSPAELSPLLQPDGTSSVDKAHTLMDAAFRGEAGFFPWQHRRMDGTIIDTEISLKAVMFQGQKVLQATIRDITGRKKAEDELIFQKERMQCLLNVLQHDAATVRELLDLALDEAITLTRSKLGHLFLYDEDKQLFTLNSWSSEAMATCNVISQDTVYQLENTSIWGESVRQRKPVIVNDYNAADPLKKGYPEGHVGLQNFMTIPLFVDDRIVAVVGLANRPSDYEEIDALRSNLLMNSVWKGIERMQLGEALRASEEMYRAIFETTGTATIIIEADSTISLANDEFVRLSGYSREEIEGKMNLSAFNSQDDKERMVEYHRLRRVPNGAAPAHYEFNFVGRNGVVRNIYNSVNMIPNSGRSVMSCQDITFSKKAEQLIIAEKHIMELIVGEAPLPAILKSICLTIEKQLDGILCAVMLADAEGKRLRHGAAPTLPEEYCRSIDGARIGEGIGSCGTAAFTRNHVFVSNIANDPLWRKYSTLPLSHGLRSCWSSPIIDSNGILLGTYSAYSRTVRSPEEEERQHIERATYLAGIAIERTKARETLQSNLLFLKILIDTIPSPVFYKNAVGSYLGCNPAFAEAMGLLEEDIIGKTVNPCLTPVAHFHS